MAKPKTRSKEWREKISKSISQKWNEREYRTKQMDTRHSEEYTNDRSEEMSQKWQDDKFKERMTGESHPNWNPDREEVQKPYAPGWWGDKEEHINSLKEEQRDRDALTGEKFSENDTLARPHIDHDKNNHNFDNLCLLTPRTHAYVHNESLMSKEDYIKAFQEGKANLNQGIPPNHWDEKYKEEFKKDQEKENKPTSENKTEKSDKNTNEIDQKETQDEAKNDKKSDKTPEEITEKNNEKGKKEQKEETPKEEREDLKNEVLKNSKDVEEEKREDNNKGQKIDEHSEQELESVHSKSESSKVNESYSLNNFKEEEIEMGNEKDFWEIDTLTEDEGKDYDGIKHMTIVEDAQYFAPEELSNRTKLTSYIEDIALLLRGTGECLISLATRPQISREILANCGVLVSFQNHMQKDLMQELLNLDEKQKEYLSMLQKGQCIIRVNSIEKPFLLKTPDIERTWLTNEKINEYNEKIIKQKLNGLEKENESEIEKEVNEMEKIERYCKSCGRELENDSEYYLNCNNDIEKEDKDFENLKDYIKILYEKHQKGY